jgi:hypothetical protein
MNDVTTTDTAPVPDPRTAHPQPECGGGTESRPGHTQDMDPAPDHGEEIWIGRDRLTDRVLVVTAAIPGSAEPPRSPPRERVYAVAPGATWTPLIPATMPAEEVRGFGGDSPMGRAAQPVETAGGSCSSPRTRPRTPRARRSPSPRPPAPGGRQYLPTSAEHDPPRTPGRDGGGCAPGGGDGCAAGESAAVAPRVRRACPGPDDSPARPSRRHSLS